MFRAIQFACRIDTTHPVWRGDDEIPHNPATVLDSMSIEVANILNREVSTDLSVAENPAYLLELDDLLQQAKTIDDRLASWTNVIPDDWFPVSIPAKEIPQSVRDAGIYANSCDIYPDIMVAITWNDWRWTRMRILALLARYEDDPQIKTTIQSLADEVCASIPFCFGDRTYFMPMHASKSIYPSVEGQPLPKSHRQNAAAFGGWYMFTPLKETVQMAKYLRKGQAEWIRAQMKRLAKIYEVGEP